MDKILFTEDQLKGFRASTVEECGEPEGGFTCDTCSFKAKCDCVYDWYNTNGDCLMEK